MALHVQKSGVYKRSTTVVGLAGGSYVPPQPPPSNAVLRQDSGYVLREDGGKIVRET